MILFLKIPLEMKLSASLQRRMRKKLPILLVQINPDLTGKEQDSMLQIVLIKTSIFSIFKTSYKIQDWTSGDSWRKEIPWGDCWMGL